jgi:hypothetical protein
MTTGLNSQADRYFSLHHRVQTGSGTPSASYEMITEGSIHGIKRPMGKADRSPPSSAKVKNAWNYTSIPPVRIRGVVLN